MPTFPKPRFRFEFDVQKEIRAIRKHRTTRGVPRKAPDRLLVATWNIANFGAQERRDQDHHILADSQPAAEPSSPRCALTSRGPRIRPLHLRSIPLSLASRAQPNALPPLRA